MSDALDHENLDELQNSTGIDEPIVSVTVSGNLNDFQHDPSEQSGSSTATTPLERSQETSQEFVDPSRLVVKEWNTLVNLLARIPVKAQKGFSTMDLKLTCIATINGVEEVLVLGTNVGVVYWYNRKSDVLDRLRCEGLHPVTSLSCVSTVDYMVAAGNLAGIVTIFQIPRDSSTDIHQSYERQTKTSQRFLVQNLHKGAITALEWSRNGMKLFSGDQSGHVVVTDIDYDLVQIRSSVLTCENHEVVQLSYARKNLLICSTFRSILYSLESKSFNTVGSLERKVTGKFGGLILSSAWDESPQVYSVRPGARLWVANLGGVVQHTFKFKELIASDSQPEIHVIKPTKTPRVPPPVDIQFTRVFSFMKNYLVTSYKDILYILDARNTAIFGICKELRSILDVAVSKDEIFILESTRNVIRLSAKADRFANTNFTLPGSSPNYAGLSNSGSNSSYDEFSAGIRNIPDIMSASISDFRFPHEPINFLASKLKQTSNKVINSTLITTIKTAIEADVDIEDGQKLLGDSKLSPAHPAMILEEGTYAIGGEDNVLENVYVPEPERFQKITTQPYEDVVVETVTKQRKKKKPAKVKAVKVADGGDATSDNVSVSSSVYSNTSSDNNANHLTGGGVATSSSTSASSSNRKSSCKSDATLSSSTSNSGSEGLFTDQQGGPIGLSQSWTLGVFLPNKAVTAEELQLKEELLARRLKWPELLPDSADGFLDEEPPVGESRESWKVNLRNGDREDRSSICTLVGPRYPASDDDTDSKTLSVENGSSLGTLTEKEHLRVGDNPEDSDNSRSHQEKEESGGFDSSDSDEDRYYTDIYTRYRNKDSLNTTDSINSALSFGPPSGSSLVSAGTINGVVIGTETNHQGTRSGGRLSVASEESKGESSNSLSTSTTVEEFDSTVDSRVVTDENWRRWRLPGNIVQISVCDHYLIGVGGKGTVYYAEFGGVSLQWKATSYLASAMAVSPCGSVVWRIYKGDLHSLMNPLRSGPIGDRGEQWNKLTQKKDKDVIGAAVQGSFGWLIKYDGSLEFCTAMLDSRLIPYFEKVYTPWPIQEVTCCGHKLWALTVDGRIVVRTGTSDLNPKGVDWVELKWGVNVPPACSIACGQVREDGVASVWFADSNANLYFTFEDKDLRSGRWTAWTVSVGNCVVYPQVQCSKSMLLSSIKQQVSKSLKMFSPSRPGLTLGGSKNSFWFATPESAYVYGNRNSITGHFWNPLRIDRGITVPSNWTSIYANSIYKNHGILWIVDSKGSLFYVPPGGGKLQPVDLPELDQQRIVSIAPAPEALWALTSSGDIYGRSDINSMDCVGTSWGQIPLTSLNSIQFVHISCGSEVAWGADDRGEVYMRIGSLRPPAGVQDMSPAWNKVEASVCFTCVRFTHVYVGGNDSMVWALDDKKRIYVRQAVFPDYPIGTGWLLVKGITAIMLSISDTAVWALSSSGDIYRRFGITKTNFVGDYWRKLPGSATAITASLCDELWALNGEGHLTKHSRKVMELRGCNTERASSSPSPSKIVLDEEDEDWEVVDNPNPEF